MKTMLSTSLASLFILIKSESHSTEITALTYSTLQTKLNTRLTFAIEFRLIGSSSTIKTSDIIKIYRAFYTILWAWLAFLSCLIHHISLPTINTIVQMITLRTS